MKKVAVFLLILVLATGVLTISVSAEKNLKTGLAVVTSLASSKSADAASASANISERSTRAVITTRAAETSAAVATVRSQSGSEAKIRPERLAILLPGMARRSSSSEAKIRAALSSGEEVYYKISWDFSFGVVGGSYDQFQDGELNGHEDMPDETAIGAIEHFLGGKIIRIQGGEATIDDGDYECSLEPGEDGIVVTITRGDFTSTSQGEMQGVLMGDTLSGMASAIQSTVDAWGAGSGYSAMAEFSVSVLETEADQLPPEPVENLSYEEKSDHSIRLSWDDPNPSGVVESYDIYRVYGMVLVTKKAATVSGGTTHWIDKSNTAKTENSMLYYYIIAHGANGLDSVMSATVDVYVMNRLFGW